MEMVVVVGETVVHISFFGFNEQTLNLSLPEYLFVSSLKEISSLEM